MKFDYTFLKARIDALGYRSFLRAVRSSKKRYDKLLRGEGYFRMEEIRRAATVLEIPAEELNRCFFEPSDDKEAAK